jgi:hypothetical protein
VARAPRSAFERGLWSDVKGLIAYATISVPLDIPIMLVMGYAR